MLHGSVRAHRSSVGSANESCAREYIESNVGSVMLEEHGKGNPCTEARELGFSRMVLLARGQQMCRLPTATSSVFVAATEYRQNSSRLLKLLSRKAEEMCEARHNGRRKRQITASTTVAKGLSGGDSEHCTKGNTRWNQ